MGQVHTSFTQVLQVVNCNASSNVYVYKTIQGIFLVLFRGVCFFVTSPYSPDLSVTWQLPRFANDAYIQHVVRTWLRRHPHDIFMFYIDTPAGL